MDPLGKRDHSFLFVLLVLILLLAFYINVKRQKGLLDRELSPTASAWDRVVREKTLEKTLGLFFIRNSKSLTGRVYEFLYPRRYTPEGISNSVPRILKDRDVGVGKVTISKKTRDVTFVLGSREKPFAELVCTPDMSTHAGKICLIIDDFGYSLNSIVNDFLELGVPATFSVLPGHAFSSRVADLAHDAGFEVMVHMPMESSDHRAGEEEFILKAGQKESEIRSRLRRAFLEIPHAQGVNNHQGSDATENRRLMRTVAEVLRAERKYFVDSRTSSKSVAVEQMQRADVPVAVRHVFLDYEDDEETVLNQLTVLEEKAREVGVAVGIAHPREKTLAAFRREISRLSEEGFEFVFASEIVR
ncbi:MAG: divergent polysaccharide deacetylase family protein [Candidatus Neomarinimicrobiota bacterium]